MGEGTNFKEEPSLSLSLLLKRSLRQFWTKRTWSSLIIPVFLSIISRKFFRSFMTLKLLRSCYSWNLQLMLISKSWTDTQRSLWIKVNVAVRGVNILYRQPLGIIWLANVALWCIWHECRWSWHNFQRFYIVEWNFWHELQTNVFNICIVTHKDTVSLSSVLSSQKIFKYSLESAETT